MSQEPSTTTTTDTIITTLNSSTALGVVDSVETTTVDHQNVRNGNNDTTSNSTATIKYIAQFHTTDWYCHQKERITNHHQITVVAEPNCLKYELDHLYLKREYLKVIELIFHSIGMPSSSDHCASICSSCRQPSTMDDAEPPSSFFSNETIDDFIKLFKQMKLPIVIRREILDTFLRCLLKILDQLSGREYLVIKYMNAIEYEIIRKNNQLPKSQKFSKSHIASFLTQLWEYKSRVLIHFVKTTTTTTNLLSNRNSRRYLLTQCIGLLQRCIHVKESLLFLIGDELKKKGNLDGVVEQQNGSAGSGAGVDLRFKFTVVDTCYQTNVRSYSFWKIIAECYSLLGMDTCSNKCGYIATSLTRCHSLFTHLQTNKTYTKEKVNVFMFDENQANRSYLSREIKDIDQVLPLEIKNLNILDEHEDAIFDFDNKFVNIYINNGKTIYSIFNEQRGMKSNESSSTLDIPSREGDDEAPRTFDASQL